MYMTLVVNKWEVGGDGGGGYATGVNWLGIRTLSSSSSSSSSGTAFVTIYNYHYWVVVFHPRTAYTGSLDSVPLLC